MKDIEVDYFDGYVPVHQEILYGTQPDYHEAMMWNLSHWETKVEGQEHWRDSGVKELLPATKAVSQDLLRVFLLLFFKSLATKRDKKRRI